jgi:hypothetical protein
MGSDVERLFYESARLAERSRRLQREARQFSVRIQLLIEESRQLCVWPGDGDVGLGMSDRLCQNPLRRDATIPRMVDDRSLSDDEADAINEQMARAMEERRRVQPERRGARRTASPSVERRRICGYCYQPGDHPTAAHCMRALERP